MIADNADKTQFISATSAFICVHLRETNDSIYMHNLDLTQKYSYADYLSWKMDKLVEIIKGNIMKMSPAPLTAHQMLSNELLYPLLTYSRKKKCKVFEAPFDVRLPLKGKTADNEIFTVVQPDICVICDRSKIDRRGCLGAPDLIIEILSAATADRDLKDKYQIYEESGVREYWLVHPAERTLIVFDLNESQKYQLRGFYTQSDIVKVGIFEDLNIDLKEVFEVLDEFDF